MTLDFFNHQMARLAGLRFRPADLTTHWEALRDLPEHVLEAAVARAQRTRVEFPTPIELRQDADLSVSQGHSGVVVMDRSVPLVEPFSITVPEAGTVLSVTREWKYYHEDCSDSGWASWWCGEEADRLRKPWQPVKHCGRSGPHGSHEWVGPCSCWATNPALVLKRESQARYAAERAKAS